MPQVGSNFEYSGRKPLDARQQCESLEKLKANVNNILYPPGFKVFCLLEHKEYKNMAKMNETPIWEDSSTGAGGKAWVMQVTEPADKNLIWIKEEDSVAMIDGEYTIDDVVNMIKAYDKKVTAVLDIIKQLQDDVAYIKKHGTVVNPDNPDNPDADIENALVTEDGTYLVTEEGVYLVTQGGSATPEPTPKPTPEGEKLTTSEGKYLVTDKQQFIKISR